MNTIIDFLSSMSNWAIILLLLVGLGKVYSIFKNEQPKNLLKLKDISDGFKTSHPAFNFLLPIVALAAMMYNLILNAAWFLGIVFNQVASWTSFLYKEIIVAALFMLCRIIWHYLIVWPWSILSLCFQQIKTAAQFKYYKIAARGLFLSGAIVFFTKYLSAHTFIEDSQTQYLFNLFTSFLMICSLIPIGIAAALIVHDRKHNHVGNRMELGKKFIINASTIIGSYIVLYGIQCTLIYISTYTSLGMSIASLLVGGGFLSSFLLIFNALLLLFILSALPAFSNDYSGDYKQIYRPFLQHLFDKGAQYLLVFPAILIPAALITIIPLMLTKGVVHKTGQIANGIYDHQITLIQSKIDNAKIPAYSQWHDINAISNDSLSKLVTADINHLGDRLQLQTIQNTKNFISGTTQGFANDKGALFDNMMHQGYDRYKSMHNEHQHVAAKDIAAADSATFGTELDAANSKINTDTATISAINVQLTNLKAQLAAVCDTSKKPEEAVAKTEETKKTEMPKEEKIDACEAQRVALQTQIAETESILATQQKQLERDKAIMDHISTMNSKLFSNNSSEMTSASIAHLLLGLWFCLLTALGLAYLLSLFANVNYMIYADGSSLGTWMVTEEIQAAKAKNKHQPLLGIALLIVLCSFIKYTDAFKLHSNFMKYYKPSKEFIEKTYDKGIEIKDIIIKSADGLDYKPILNFLNPLEEKASETEIKSEATNSKDAATKSEDVNTVSNEAPAVTIEERSTIAPSDIDPEPAEEATTQLADSTTTD